MPKISARLRRTFDGNEMFSWFSILLLVFSLYLVYLILSPFKHTIILSIILAATFNPLCRRISDRMGGKNFWAAFITVHIIVICILIPTFLFVTGLAGQGVEMVTKLNAWIRSTDFNQLLQDANLDPYINWLHEKIPFIDLSKLDFQGRLIELSQRFGQTLIKLGGNIIGNIVIISLHFLLMVFILFYLLKDGRQIMESLRFLLPLRDRQIDVIFHSLRNVSRSVLVGGLLVALLQGFVGGIGLALVGIPAMFWGTMMAFASLVPVLGTGLIWVPATIYLLLAAQWKAAIFLALWCGIGVTSIDTFLRPYFLRDAAGVPTIYIFTSVIGGLQAFGPTGLLYGPLILSFAMAVLRIYSEEYRHVLDSPRKHGHGPLIGSK